MADPAAQDAPRTPFTHAEVIKCDPGRDLYVAWSHIVEAPTWAGTRAEAVSEGCEPDRLGRADETGSSYHLFCPGNPVPVPGLRWGKSGLVAEQLGHLPRERLAAYAAAYVRGRYRRAYGMLEQFEDDSARPRDHRACLEDAARYWKRLDRQAARRKRPLAVDGDEYQRRLRNRRKRNRG